MKKLFFTAATVVFILFACSDPYVDAPYLPGGQPDSRSIGSPGNVIATHGGKRSIELRWDEIYGAVRYNIFKADSPLLPFVPCAETTSTRFNFAVPAGSTVYYRVSAILANGQESAQSYYARGSSLAQPIITDITDVSESSATVTWYMENAAEDTYKNNLLYTVYCYNGSVEIAQVALNAAELMENKAVFTNLSPNTRYEYQVEAYLRSDQNVIEKSDKVDAATARRFRPGAPFNLRAARGTAINSVKLTFELPDMVDIALGENQYERKPVYFVISKRRYSASGSNEYLKICSYFGSIAANAENSADSFSGYVPGATVTWTESINIATRGVEYEYQVQAYVDDTSPPRIITSDSSKASARGWALSVGSLSFGDIHYTRNESGSLYTDAELPLVFDFDPKGEIYDYTLVETIDPIGGNPPHQHDPDGSLTIRYDLTYDDITHYAARMDLAQKTDANTRGCGVYSYKVEIKLNGGIIDTVETIGKVEVSEDTQPIIVEGFSVQDGYKDKFVLKWHYQGNRGYVLYMSDDGKTGWTQIATVNDNPDDDSTDVNMDYSYPYTTGVDTSLTKYFAIQPFRDVGGGQPYKQGQMVYARTASQTLGVPVISLSQEPSYSNITAIWTEAQKADTYRIKYWYTGEGSYATAVTAATVNKNDPALIIDANGDFKYSFSPFANNIADAARAGLKIQVAVDALNEGLRAAVGGAEIATTSGETVTTQLVGPALLSPSATHAASHLDIDVSWNKITGASGYYVYRRQFNMNNTAEEGTESLVYYVPASEAASFNPTGKNLALDVSGAKVDATTIKAAAYFNNGRYTLKDIYLTDTEYDGVAYNRHLPAYRDQQNDMAQGFSYRYYILPVINQGGAPEPLTSIEFTYLKDGSNKNTNINYYNIRENNRNIRYNGAAAFEKDGFTIGFGQNVVATKGTYASGGNVNNGIQVSWSLPPRLASVTGFSPRYTVYRRTTGVAQWDTVTSNQAAMQYVDIDIRQRGTAFEYVIGISNGSGAPSEPKSTRRFIARCGTLRDERDRPHYLGFMLDMVTMRSVSRDARTDARGNFGELVEWYNAGIKNPYGTDNYNWGIDGYTIYVMNRNINANWHIIADISSNIPNQINQSALVTTGMGSVTLDTSAGDMSFDMLRVMRDYKHYFKVRSYVKNSDGEKVYCPDPEYTYTHTYNAGTGTFGGAENEYVKWGARQVSATEFFTIAAIHVADGIQQGTSNWAGSLSAGNPVNANGTGTRGSVAPSHSIRWGTAAPIRYDWRFNFSNYKTDLQIRTGDWNVFLTINGQIWAYAGDYQYPTDWGDEGDITVTGPADTPLLYTGKMSFGQSGNRNLPWGDGVITVRYPDPNAARQVISYTGERSPMVYYGRGDTRYQLEHFK